jgi:hypothetical protein
MESIRTILSVLSKRYVKEPATWNVVNLRPENRDYGAAGIGPPHEDFNTESGKIMVRHYL